MIGAQQLIKQLWVKFDALDIDLVAIQEVKDTTAFKQLTNALDGYDGYLEKDRLFVCAV